MPPFDTMRCPLCSATLTAANDRDKNGRFHCLACMPTSAEAQRGWLPRARPLATAGQPVPKGLTPAMVHDPMFGLNAAGDPITRESTCECGTRFTQRQLSARFLEGVERFSAGAIAAVSRQIPDYFVPVFCPHCERIDLGHRSVVDSAHAGERPRVRQPEFSLAAD